jgi:hypothetical protein
VITGEQLLTALKKLGPAEAQECSPEEIGRIALLTLGPLTYGYIYAKAFYMPGKIAEQPGDKARAHENYGRFPELWKNADSGLPRSKMPR